VASHTLDRTLALGETIDATEADAYFAMPVQPQQARLNLMIAAAPTARFGNVVATDSSSLHDESSA
jgi:hypothetical protein